MLKQTAELVNSQVPRASIETRPEENFGGLKMIIMRVMIMRKMMLKMMILKMMTMMSMMIT